MCFLLPGIKKTKKTHIIITIYSFNNFSFCEWSLHFLFPLSLELQHKVSGPLKTAPSIIQIWNVSEMKLPEAQTPSGNKASVEQQGALCWSYELIKPVCSWLSPGWAGNHRNHRNHRGNQFVFHPKILNSLADTNAAAMKRRLSEREAEPHTSHLSLYCVSSHKHWTKANCSSAIWRARALIRPSAAFN